jgi:hypothetical protein
MREFAPGNYTIVPSGYYHHIELMGYCGFEKNAWENYGGTGPYVSYTRDTGQVSAMVSNLVVPDGSHYLKFNHTGGPIGISIIPVASTACGDLTYKVYYGAGPAFSEDYNATELENNEFNATETGYDLAVLGYQAIAGCVLGQAGKKGGMLDGLHSIIPGWSAAINDDVTESPAYLISCRAGSLRYCIPAGHPCAGLLRRHDARGLCGGCIEFAGVPRHGTEHF